MFKWNREEMIIIVSDYKRLKNLMKLGKNPSSAQNAAKPMKQHHRRRHMRTKYIR